MSRCLTRATPHLLRTTPAIPSACRFISCAACPRAVVPTPVQSSWRIQIQAQKAAPSLSLRRTYSVNAVEGSKIWEFEEVKKQAEENQNTAGANANVVIVDVREPAELQATGKIPTAVNIPITSAAQSFHISDADFEDMYGFERPSKASTLLFYCKAGVRAKSAAGLAKHAGWQNVGEYTGSWLDWEAKGGPVERVKASEGIRRD